MITSIPGCISPASWGYLVTTNGTTVPFKTYDSSYFRQGSLWGNISRDSFINAESDYSEALNKRWISLSLRRSHLPNEYIFFWPTAMSGSEVTGWISTPEFHFLLCTQAFPSTMNIAGRYSTGSGILTLSQLGMNVTGTYGENKRVRGLILGNTFNGVWEEPGGSGNFSFTFAPGGASFQGVAGYGNSFPTNIWNGTRIGYQQ